MKLSDKEWRVLNALWVAPEGLALGAVVDALRPDTGWSRSTVLTYLTRMEAKGLVDIRKEDFPHRYRAAVSREDCAAAERRGLLERAYQGSAGKLVAAGGIRKQVVGSGKPCPVLGDDLFRRKAAGALAALQRTGQVGHGGSGLLLPGQLGTADQHPARVGRLGCQHVLSLRRKRFRQHGIHYGDHIADVIPAVQRVVPQHIKKLVHIKDSAGFHHHPVEPAHCHGNELGAHPALVGVAVAPAADRLDLAVVAQKVLHQHGVHVHGAEVVFQNADIVPLCHQICRVPAQKCGLSGSQKAGDEIYLYHRCPLRCFDFRVSIL